MSPADYKKARDSLQEITWVHDRPYLPQFTVNSTNADDSVQKVAAMILALLKTNDEQKETKATTNGENGSSNCCYLDHKEDEQQIDQLLDVVSKERMKVEKVKGGITNTLYRVTTTATAECSASVLVRVFGGHGMIDRDEENANYAALAARGIAPPYYGRFANGRIEGWMEGMRPLETTELSQPNIARGIAVQLAKLHFEFTGVILERTKDETTTADEEPTMWTQLYDWLDQAEKATFQTQQETVTCQSLQLTKKIRPELTWLKQQIGLENAQNVFVFCHNDLLAANVLYDDDTKRIQLIDFEYGGINYRAFDIANHFNEYAGGPPEHADPDYSLLPSAQQQRDFIETYLQTASSSAVAVTDKAIDDMVAEVQCFLLANHLYWGLWGINQAATEGCNDYDYMLYAVNRIRQYWITKQG